MLTTLSSNTDPRSPQASSTLPWVKLLKLLYKSLQQPLQSCQTPKNISPLNNQPPPCSPPRMKCNDQPDPKPTICLRMLLLTNTSINACPETPLTNNLLPATEPPSKTPSPSTPPMMASTPDPSLPSTHQPSPQKTRQPSNGQTCSNPPASAPFLESHRRTSNMACLPSSTTTTYLSTN